MQELMKEGRKGVQEIDGALNRAEKVVEDTLQIGQQVSYCRDEAESPGWATLIPLTAYHSHDEPKQ